MPPVFLYGKAMRSALLADFCWLEGGAMKLAIIGTGSVGGQAAFVCAERGVASSIVLLDSCAHVAQAKALDIHHAMAMQGVMCSIIGTDDWQHTYDSDVVVITAGFARRPGMKRSDLLSINAEIVRTVAIQAAKYSPNSILIVVTNPVNTMSALVQRVTEFPAQKVIGMGGVLDNARFKAILSTTLTVEPSMIESIVIGDHGEHMLPVLSQCSVNGHSIYEYLGSEDIADVINRTRYAGTEIVNLMGNGSAYFAPAMAIAAVVQAVVDDRKETLCCSTRLDGQYGLSGDYVGMPVCIGSSGAEAVIEYALTTTELEFLLNAANCIREQAREIDT